MRNQEELGKAILGHLGPGVPRVLLVPLFGFLFALFFKLAIKVLFLSCFQAPSGFSCLLLRPPGSSGLLLPPPGCSWLITQKLIWGIDLLDGMLFSLAFWSGCNLRWFDWLPGAQNSPKIT